MFIASSPSADGQAMRPVLKNKRMKKLSIFFSDAMRRNLTVAGIVLAASCNLSAQEGGFGTPLPSLTEDPKIGFELVEYQKNPVIGKDHPDCKDNKYGFEGGAAIKLKDTYHMFTCEYHGDPYLYKTRLAHWTSPDALAWKRQSTIFETTGELKEVSGRPYNNIVAPIPVFNKQENRWDLFYVTYTLKITGAGWIWRAQSTVPGIKGIGGPYKEIGVVLKPDKESQIWEGWGGTASFAPFQAGKNKWLSFYCSAASKDTKGWPVGLASAPALSGPWKRLPKGNPILIEPVFNENPIVTRIGKLYVIVYDSDILNPTEPNYFTENHSIGYATSKDGIHWSKGGRITVQPDGDANWAKDIRTPLGLIDEGHGLFTLVYTAFGKKGYQPVGTVKLKLVNKK